MTAPPIGAPWTWPLSLVCSISILHPEKRRKIQKVPSSHNDSVDFFTKKIDMITGIH